MKDFFFCGDINDLNACVFLECFAAMPYRFTYTYRSNIDPYRRYI